MVFGFAIFYKNIRKEHMALSGMAASFRFSAYDGCPADDGGRIGGSGFKVSVWNITINTERQAGRIRVFNRLW